MGAEILPLRDSHETSRHESELVEPEIQPCAHFMSISSIRYISL